MEPPGFEDWTYLSISVAGSILFPTLPVSLPVVLITHRNRKWTNRIFQRCVLAAY